jgi:hypothetical protein
MKLQPKDQTLLEQAYQTIFEGGMPPTAGAASRTGANPGVTSAGGEPISDAQMQEALAILNQYAQGDITNTEAAKMFKDLYEKGAGHGPTQDDMHATGPGAPIRRPDHARFSGAR